MINKDFFAALDALESEKGISKEYFLDALQSALATAYKRNFNEVRPVEVVLDEGRYSIDMYAYRTVVSEVSNPDSEIALQDAKLIKKTCKLGEKLKQKIAPKEFGKKELPVLYNVNIGHASPIGILPLGTDVQVDFINKKITLIESPIK